MLTTDEHGLYRDGWKGEITPEAFAHPAKYSRALIRWIYQHMLGEGWLKPGDHVIDPFGGVALGALDAMQLGINWTGVELESRATGGNNFVELGNQNIALWNHRLRGVASRGTAVLLQGDSRELLRVLHGQAQAAVSSPPYADSMEKPNGIDLDLIKRPGGPNSQSRLDPRYSAALSSPPYADGSQHTGGDDPHPEHIKGCKLHLPGISGVVSSPPYAESEINAQRNVWSLENIKGNYANIPHDERDLNYGSTPGQLGAMKPGDWQASVSSPPFEKTIGHDGGYEHLPAIGNFAADYGNSDGNIVNATGDTFWSAARQIVEQVHLCLAPGAHAVWVVKAFVKNGQRVDFPGQWQALCEAVGFETLHLHRCWLVENKGTQIDLNGDKIHKTIKRASFFRRLAESKGSPPIDWEIVLCMRKPESVLTVERS